MPGLSVGFDFEGDEPGGRRRHFRGIETIDACVALWQREAMIRLSEREATEAAYQVRACAEACGWQYPADVTRESIVGWLAEGVEGGRSGKWHNNALARVRGFARWLADTGRLAKNPAETIGKARHSATGGLRAFTVDEMRAVIAVVYEGRGDRRRTTRRADAYVLAGLTGLRKSELFALRWSMWDRDARRLELPGAITKSGRPERVELEDEAQDILESLRGRDAQVRP